MLSSQVSNRVQNLKNRISEKSSYLRQGPGSTSHRSRMPMAVISTGSNNFKGAFNKNENEE